MHIHEEQHVYSCKSYQRISVSVMEVFFKPQNIAKVPNSDSRMVQTPSHRHIISKNYNSTRRDQTKNQGTALFPEFIN